MAACVIRSFELTRHPPRFTLVPFACFGPNGRIVELVGIEPEAARERRRSGATEGADARGGAAPADD